MKVFTAAALSLCALGAITSAAAGQLPAGVSQQQLQQMLLQNPDLVRQRLMSSGLTPDQIRSRLRAAGYPENLLDAYLGGSSGPTASQFGPTELAAIEALGLAPYQPEGSRRLPVDTGLIHRRGDTLAPLRSQLYTRLGRVYSGVRRGPNATTRFDISVANVRANQIYVVGEVTQPGAYQISSLGTVLTALYAAGGVTERANMRRIEVQRLGKAVASLDLYDYLLRGDTRSDIRLETGDVVFVPVHETRVQVSGAVIRPGIYELKAGEQLGDLLAASGGFRADAALQRVTVHRILAAPERGPGRAPRAALDIALAVAPPAPAGDGQGTSYGTAALGAPGIRVPALGLMDGDSVVVDSLPPLSETYYVAIAGRVNKPGRFPWRPGMTLRDLVQLARGPTIGAYLKEAEIARLPQDRSGGQLACRSPRAGRPRCRSIRTTTC